MRCTFCGSHLHMISLCPKTLAGSATRLHLRCAYCGSRDHDIVACPKTWSGNAARTWHEDEVKNHFKKD